MTLYLPRYDWWVYVQVLYEYGIQGEQVLSRPTADFQTFRINIYQTASDTSALSDAGMTIESKGRTVLIFDGVKLALYSIFFGQRLYESIKFFISSYIVATGSDFFNLIWNTLVTFFNISNFVLFLMLSRNYDANEILRKNEFVDSYQLQSLYRQAQLYDSFLVLMNMFMLIEFTQISRRVSLLIKLIGITAPYLIYLVIAYLMMLYLMAMIVWQVWGDKLPYFRNLKIASMYTLALFDLKSMYLGQDFMAANQYGVDSIWLFILIILFAVILHYSITLQYSAYFHIYF